MSALIVFGSINVDYVAQVNRLPGPGETVKTDAYEALPGGKGANQALAARRNGAGVTMVGAVGDDGLGRVSLGRLREEGVALDTIATLPGASGLALIAVDRKGENQIVVISGANALAQAVQIPPMGAGDVLVTQNEVDWTQTAAAHALAKAAGARVVHNAAPAHAMGADELANIHVLVVNEHELALAVPAVEQPAAQAEALLAQGVGAVVLTLGAAGATCFEAGQEPLHIDAVPAHVVDTTGAGDAFVGALSAALARGEPLDQCLALANIYAAKVCSVLGAQTPVTT